jgi:hypothetical protein
MEQFEKCAKSKKLPKDGQIEDFWIFLKKISNFGTFRFIRPAIWKVLRVKDST